MESVSPEVVQRRRPFQRNVRDTNDLGQVSRRTTIVAVAVTFLMAMAVGRSSDPVLAYFLFLVGGLIALSQHPKAQEMFAYPAFKPINIVRPIFQSLAIGAPLLALLVIGLGLSFAPGTAQEKVFAVFLFAVIGGFVEEYIRWAWLQTLPYSLISANLMWVMLHPQVARVFSGEAPDIFFAVFAFEFGLLMTLVMWLYESRVPGAAGFGPIAAASFHAIFNGFVIIYMFSIVDINFTYLGVG